MYQGRRADTAVRRNVVPAICVPSGSAPGTSTSTTRGSNMSPVCMLSVTLVALAALAVQASAGSQANPFSPPYAIVYPEDGGRSNPLYALVRYSDEINPVPIVRLWPEADDGEYLVQISGDSSMDYSHVRVTVKNGQVSAVESRPTAMRIAGGIARNVTSGIEFAFEPSGPPNFIQKTASTYALRRLLNKWTILQIMAGLFVIWFPRYLANVDPAMLAEISGEATPVKEDPNAYLERLIT